MKNRILFGFFAGWVGLIALPSMVHACSVCVTGIDGPVADAFNWSVLFLMATPYTVVGTIAGWLFYTYRRAAAKQEKQETIEVAQPLVQLVWNHEETGK